jgi:methylated-DNA-[protein]-cysteine S-methyltransferase
MPLTSEVVESPLGALSLVHAGNALVALFFGAQPPLLKRYLERHFPGEASAPHPCVSAVARQLEAYFNGRLEALGEIAVAPRGTPFQGEVWRLLRAIPPGETCSYAELARRLGSRLKTRAVGLATAANPVAIVVPCHRVLGSNGQLTGFSGGLERKRWLLAHETAYSRRSPSGPLFA